MKHNLTCVPKVSAIIEQILYIIEITTCFLVSNEFNLDINMKPQIYFLPDSTFWQNLFKHMSS